MTAFPVSRHTKAQVKDERGNVSMTTHVRVLAKMVDEVQGKLACDWPFQVWSRVPRGQSLLGNGACIDALPLLRALHRTQKAFYRHR